MKDMRAQRAIINITGCYWEDFLADCRPWWTERNPQSVELLVTLQQEAKSQNLFNEDEEDIERYIDDDDDDFVDHVRFQSQQVRKHLYTVHHHFQSLAGFPMVRHLGFEMFHLSNTKKWIVPVCKDLSRVGLADSPQMDGYHGGYAGLSKMK